MNPDDIKTIANTCSGLVTIHVDLFNKYLTLTNNVEMSLSMANFMMGQILSMQNKGDDK